MSLRITNTLTRRKEPFEPLDKNHVRMYVCGPTVYDFAHIGNARPVVVFDVLYRLLKSLYPPPNSKVTYVRNITDVDDKIIAASGESGEPIDAITKRYADIYRADMAALGALPPDVEPRATDHIPRMIAMMEKLIASGHAYAAERHVLFSVPAMPDYGRLSRHSRDELIAGARVEVAPYKQDPADFVLWKPSDDDQPGWDSPWGRGRPGWHLECSAMSEAHLGVTFDIHGGGQDLIFPHHENEIAQSVCAHGGAPFVRYWMHNGYLTVDGEKMSKSLGNFYTVRQLLDEGWQGEVIRYVLLSAHYRQPLDFSEQALTEAKSTLDKLYRALRDSDFFDVDAERYSLKDNAELVEDDQPLNRVQIDLMDDLNTPNALGRLHVEANRIQRALTSRKNEIKAFRSKIGQRKISFDDLVKLQGNKSTWSFGSDLADILLQRSILVQAGCMLGILQRDHNDWFKGTEMATRYRVPNVVTTNEEMIDKLIAARAKAREEKDFAEADRIRDELAEKGIILEDSTDGGTTWRRA